MPTCRGLAEAGYVRRVVKVKCELIISRKVEREYFVFCTVSTFIQSIPSLS